MRARTRFEARPELERVLLAEVHHDLGRAVLDHVGLLEHLHKMLPWRVLVRAMLQRGREALEVGRQRPRQLVHVGIEVEQQTDRQVPAGERRG